MTQPSSFNQDPNEHLLLDRLAHECELDIGDAVVQLTEVDDFTTFKAEYTFRRDADIVVHFFRTPEIRALQAQEQYWKQAFPLVLDEVARGFFEGEVERLRGEFIPEPDSWYFHALGYANKLDNDAYLAQFLVKMDERLESVFAQMQ